MTGGGWSCPHEVNGACGKIKDLPCDPGMKGCELYGRYAFFDPAKNARLLQKKARITTEGQDSDSSGEGADAHA